MGAAGLQECLWMSETLLSAILVLFLKACSQRCPSCWEWAGAGVVFVLWRIYQQLRFACSLFYKQAREWNGWGYLASAWPHGTSWPAFTLLRDECVSGSSSVLPSCGFWGSLQKKQKVKNSLRKNYRDLHDPRNRSRGAWERVKEEAISISRSL